VSLGALLGERGLDRCVLIGNIPYHLTRDVLFDFLVTGVISRHYDAARRATASRPRRGAAPTASRVWCCRACTTSTWWRR
jgi:hypothetical protein